jgi:signal transduction histidine kinase/ligand-binding sensor domain-containing protein/DNA-binding response OmpR family regulator
MIVGSICNYEAKIIKMKYILIFILLSLPLSSFSQVMSFQHLNVEDGLNHSIIYSIAQDQYDLMWFATKYGIGRYNGYNFKYYYLDEDQFPLGDKDQVNKIYTDSKNGIWAAARNTIYRYNRNKDHFERLKTFEGSVSSDNGISDFLEDINHNIWIGTRRGIAIYNSEKDSIETIPGFNKGVTCFWQSKNLDIWVGTRTGLFCYNPVIQKFIPISENSFIQKQIEELTIQALREDSEHKLWIGTRSSGVYTLDLRQDILEKTEINELKNVKDFEPHVESGMYVATDGEGMFLLDDALKIKRNYQLDEDDHKTLNNNGIYDLYKDINNRIWIATYGGGINIYDPNLKAFQVIRHKIKNENSLSNNTSRAILEDSNGRLWFGTKKGISVLSRKTGEWKHFTHDPDDPNSLPNNIVLALSEDNKQNIWAGTFSGGACKINPHTGRITRYQKELNNPNSLSTNYIYDIYVDSKNNIWFGGIRKGDLVKFTSSTGKFERYNVRNVRCISETRDGKIIAGGRNGLAIINPVNKTIDKYSPIPGDTTSLSNILINCILEDEEGRLILATDGGGLNIFNKKTKTFSHFTKKNGLPSNVIHGILPDGKNKFWLSTDKGLVFFNLTNKSCISIYNKADGLAGTEFNYGAYAKLSTGEMVFGGQNGFTIFDPDKIQKNEFIPNLVFENFKLFHKNITPHLKNSLLEVDINETKSIQLNHDQNTISFEFAALNFTNSENNQYKWKLEGFDSDWIKAGRERVAAYTNLPSGEYIFKVMASNNDGIWGDNMRKINIIIYPPFYASEIAYIIYVIGLILTLFFSWYFVSLYYKEKHASERIDFFVSIAHDIKTPLTLIKGPIEKIKEEGIRNDEHTDKMFNLVKHNIVRLNNLTDQLLAFQRLNVNSYRLTISNIFIQSHLDKLLINFKPLLEQKKLKVIKNYLNEDFEFWCDIDLIDKIFYNLFSNAIKYSFDEGEIYLTVKRKRKEFIFTIEDNGRGVPKDQQKHIFRRYFRASNAVNSEEPGSGVGLMLIQKLVDIHKGKISFKSEENKGTSFTLMIPNVPIQKNSKEVAEEFLLKTNELNIASERNFNNDQSKPKVVIVEDNKDLRRYLSENLSKKFRILSACDGKSGLEKIKKFHPDLVISDIMMPKMNGMELCAKIKNDVQLCHIPVILLSGLTSVDSKIEGMEFGAIAYVEKPFDINYLMARIENIFNSRKILHDKFERLIKDPSDLEFKNEINQKFIRNLVEIININMENSSFSVTKLCKEIGMSRPSLFLKLKALTGKSPQEFIKVIKLQKAEKLIREGTIPIKEVAYDVGFSDSKYFSTAFKKHFGSSPSNYNKENAISSDKFFKKKSLNI